MPALAAGGLLTLPTVISQALGAPSLSPQSRGAQRAVTISQLNAGLPAAQARQSHGQADYLSTALVMLALLSRQ